MDIWAFLSLEKCEEGGNGGERRRRLREQHCKKIAKIPLLLCDFCPFLLTSFLFLGRFLQCWSCTSFSPLLFSPSERRLEEKDKAWTSSELTVTSYKQMPATGKFKEGTGNQMNREKALDSHQALRAQRLKKIKITLRD